MQLKKFKQLTKIVAALNEVAITKLLLEMQSI